jgi:4-carboxymuconolactone decarboxylase
VIVDTVRALYRARRLTPEQFARAEAEFGRQDLVELVTLAGYYGMIAGVLNAFDVDLPPGLTAPFGHRRDGGHAPRRA